MTKGNREGVPFMVSYHANENISKDLGTIRKITDLLKSKNLPYYFHSVDCMGRRTFFIIPPQLRAKKERELRESVEREIEVIVRGS